MIIFNNAVKGIVLKRTSFWSESPDDEQLINQIIATKKTATSFPKVWYYNIPNEEPTHKGDLVAVFNQKGEHRCTIEITDVYEVAFGKVSDSLVEEENFSSKEEFWQFTAYCYERDLIAQGYYLNEDTIFVVEHFKLISICK